MGDDTMSQDEINDLLSDIGVDTDEIDACEDEETGNNEQALVKIYDFFRPDVFTEIELSMIRSSVDALMEAGASFLGRFTGTEVKMTVTSIDPLTLDELMRCQPNPSLYLSLDCAIPEKGGFFFPLSPASVLNRLFIGLPAEADRSKISPVEDDILREVFGTLVRQSFTDPLRDNLHPCRLSTVHTKPEPELLGDPMEMILTFSFDMSLPEYNITGLSTLALPAAFIHSLQFSRSEIPPQNEESSGDLLVQAGLEFPLLLDESKIVDSFDSGAELSVDPRSMGVMSYEKRRETK